MNTTASALSLEVKSVVYLKTGGPSGAKILGPGTEATKIVRAKAGDFVCDYNFAAVVAGELRPGEVKFLAEETGEDCKALLKKIVAFAKAAA